MNIELVCEGSFGRHFGRAKTQKGAKGGSQETLPGKN
jgi:hypothetical protein